MVNFCSAPWVEGVIQANGNVNICCRNLESFGNWKKQDLKSIWHSNKLIKFRKAIFNGKFPNETCRRCYKMGAQRTLHQDLNDQYVVLKSIISSFLNEPIDDIDSLESLFKEKGSNQRNERILSKFFKKISDLKRKTRITSLVNDRILRWWLFLKYDQRLKQNYVGMLQYTVALNKLKTIGVIVQSYLNGDPAPDIVMPYRLVGLITRCNISCIHCPFHYGKSIITGPDMNKKELKKAFSYQSNLIDFYLYGTELLLYNEWKMVTKILSSNCIRLSMSTNGVLLSKENVIYLIDNQLMKNLNISLEGATEKTIQNIRIGVKYEMLMNNLKYLFFYANKKKYNFNLSFSFVLMKRNYKEFPMVVKLIKELKGEEPYPFVSIFCQALGDQNVKEHAEFVNKEHHSRIDQYQLKDIFQQVLIESKTTGIPVHVFGSNELEDFIQEGYPFPPI
jgi:radical SAM protein with 4Fe4S-binding SPASM domain